MASEDCATEKQVKRLYAVLHSLGWDPKEFKKERNFASYERLTRQQCSDLITELEDLEAELTEGKDTDTQKAFTERQPPAQPITSDVHDEMQAIATVMRLAIRHAVRITADEVNGKIDNQGLAGLTKDVAICMFRQKMREEERA
jgi:hypothetical protein